MLPVSLILVNPPHKEFWLITKSNDQENKADTFIKYKNIRSKRFMAQDGNEF